MMCWLLKKLVFLKGIFIPDLLIICEAPGYQENETGVPFVGNLGAFLEHELQKAHINIASITFINAVFRLPLDINGCLRVSLY
ncbi:Uracil DNA glycosylase superfamily protein [compost metagenome]